MPYIICCRVDEQGARIVEGAPSGLAERAFHREELAADPSLRVDTEYYLANQARVGFAASPDPRAFAARMLCLVPPLMRGLAARMLWIVPSLTWEGLQCACSGWLLLSPWRGRWVQQPPRIQWGCRRGEERVHESALGRGCLL